MYFIPESIDFAPRLLCSTFFDSATSETYPAIIEIPNHEGTEVPQFI